MEPNAAACENDKQEAFQEEGPGKKVANPRTKNYGIGQDVQPKRNQSQFRHWTCCRSASAAVLAAREVPPGEADRQDPAPLGQGGRPARQEKEPATPGCQHLGLVTEEVPARGHHHRPALCRKMGIPSASSSSSPAWERCIALTQIDKSDRANLGKQTNFNDRYEMIRMHLGDDLLGPREWPASPRSRRQRRRVVHRVGQNVRPARCQSCDRGLASSKSENHVPLGTSHIFISFPILPDMICFGVSLKQTAVSMKSLSNE
ncbi:60S ribosomal protein L7a [Culex quinquefasciatus]|uniref:60S ribosomal protein L7a n=1 Tax=Culex quinquefasciatus TaxID=7176 RepID=B0WTP0_CULQU|nr:60S ribosomal protein L7a [Culex quinquefasciatus]|eukprot:XP_001855179.1 60S ribosomal protein L7a [Culex quinquefasciatus]